MGVLTGKKVLMVLAPKDFNDEEFFKSRVALQAAGAQVLIASHKVEEATGMAGGKAKVDFYLGNDKINNEDFLAVVFIGGSGSKTYFNNSFALDLARWAVKQGKVVGAICIAPSILANAGLLQGKRATSFPSEKENLEKKGAVFTGAKVETDGKIVTAAGPQAAEEFGRKLVKVLGK